MTIKTCEELLRRYLTAMQSGDSEAVAKLSAPEATLEYPGAQRFNSVAELFGWAKGRHRWIRHEFDRFDEISGGKGIFVYVTGMLSGEFADGSAFEKIRFIYQFRIHDNLVVETRLWSDIADALRRKNAS